MSTPPIILVPGFWLGAWAWDEVVDILRADGHEVTALTLPGLESVDTDRSGVSLDDHVDAICAAVSAAGRPVVLAVHSGAGGPGYVVTDRMPEQIAHMVYVDTGAATGAADDEQDGDLPMPSLDELRQNEPLDGLTDEQLATFAARAVPEPAGAVRDTPVVTNDARKAVPSTVIATGFSSEDYQKGVEQGWGFIAGLADLTDLTWVDLPTSHWPMWSRPAELAAILTDIAERSA
jgi:pimeloyl-ACP methyl ester carboxylesterase